MENLDLINWRMLGYSSLWILGLAIVLTALGFADYQAKEARRRIREVLGQPAYRAWVNAGLALFCLGLTGSARAWWESALWWALALAFTGYAVAGWREHRRAQSPAEPETGDDDLSSKASASEDSLR